MSLFGNILKVAAPAALGFVTGGPAGAIAGGVSGLSGVAASSGTKKAVNPQLQATRDQIAASNANRDYQYSLNTPTINAGNDATGAINGFINGGNGGAGLDAYRKSTGYQDLLNTGLAAVNSSAYAKGAGDSGAALKALQAKGTSIADQSAQGWLGSEFNLAGLGGAARSLVAGVGQNTTTANNAATQSGADAQSNGALVDSSNLIKRLQQFGAQAVNGVNGSTGSSFGSGPAANNTGGFSADLSWLSNPLSAGGFRPITGLG
jgi:hypothetical protein